jgi:hypothetical protein
LSDYLTDKLQLNRFEKELDRLMNGEKEKIKLLNDQYKEKIAQIENIRKKYPNLDEIIKKYNCVQNQLIEYYSKDYMKTEEIMKLFRLKHKSNYINLVKDEIKKLKEKDQIHISKLTKESIKYKKIIDESNSKVKDLVNEVENLKKQLVFIYSGNVDKKLKYRYKNSISLLKSKTSKLDNLMIKLGPPIMLSKVFCMLNGLSGCIEQNTKFNVINSIKENVIVISNDIKEQMFENANKNNYLHFENKPISNFIDNAPFMNDKCNLIDLKIPKRAGFVKGKFNNDSSKIKINNKRKFKNK